MEQICILIFFLFIPLLFINIHKGILVYAPASILCQLYLCLRYEAPAIPLNTSIEVIILTLYFFKKKLHFFCFPLYRVIVLIVFVYILSAIVSPLSLTGILPAVVSNILSYFIVVVFYNELKNRIDLSIALKSLSITIAILGSYGIFEILSQSNPIMSYLFSIFPIEKGWVYYSEETRFGSIRCQSLLPICISWGAFCCLMLSFLFYSKKYIFKQNIIILFYSLAALSIAFIIFSGSRSAYIYLAIIFLGSVLSIKGKHRYVFALFGLICLITFKNFLLELVGDSVSADSQFSGSSTEQRQMQLFAALNVIKNSPICGLGFRGLSTAQDMDSNVLGAESVWLQQLINCGFLGVVVQIYIYCSLIQYIFKNSDKSIRVFSIFIVMGWITFCSFTSSPGLREPYFMIYLILLSKLKLLRK